jgi:hypothetical protein
VTQRNVSGEAVVSKESVISILMLIVKIESLQSCCIL